MIRSFGSRQTGDIYHGRVTSRALAFAPEIRERAQRKLDLLHGAHELKDLASPPGNRLEKLSGRLPGFYSIRINRQFRIIFRFAEGNAHDVEITDYH